MQRKRFPLMPLYKLGLSTLALMSLAGTVNPAFSQQARPRAVQTEPWKSYLVRGEQYRQQGNFPAALRDFDRALTLNPNAWEVYLARAQVYEKMGMDKRVIQNYDQAMALHPRLEQAWIQRSAYFARQGQDTQALYDLDEGIRYLPRSTNLRLARAQYFMQRRLYTRALADLDAAVAMQPQRLDARLLKADCHLALKDPDGYEVALTGILQIAPKREDIWMSRGMLYLVNGHFNLAKADFDQVIKLSPKFGEAYYYRGRSLIESKESQACAAALKDLQTACRMGIQEACYKKPPCVVPKPPAAKPSAQPSPAPSQTPAPTQTPAPSAIPSQRPASAMP